MLEDVAYDIWSVHSHLILDYYDGAIEGLLDLDAEVPQEYWFKSIYRNYDFDFILFVLLSTLPGTLQNTIAASGADCSHKNDVWNPFSGVSSETLAADVEAAVKVGLNTTEDRAILFLGRQIDEYPIGLVKISRTLGQDLVTRPELDKDVAKELVLSQMGIDLDQVIKFRINPF